MNYLTFLYIAIGGAVGACSRYAITQYSMQWFGKGFPIGTLLVNGAGSLCMGIMMALLNQGLLENSPWRPLITVGLLGALTTYSTFSMDTVNLFEQGQLFKAGLNILLNVVISIGLAWIGFKLFMKG